MERKILLVEDTDVTRHLMSEILKKNGYAVVGVRDGVSALRVLGEGAQVDAILMDIALPGGKQGMSGIKCSRIIRQKEKKGPPIPIIGVSGYTDPDIKARAAKFMNNYFHKPVDPKLLLEYMSSLWN